MQSADEGDGRQFKRRPVSLPAWADPGGVHPVIDCRIVDLTGDGARVAAASTRRLPDVFHLSADSTHVIGKVEVRWRQANQVGVKFLERA